MVCNRMCNRSCLPCVSGENLLALVKAMASSPLLPNPGEYKHGSLVFFDVLGYFVIHYPERIGFIVNSLVVLLVCASIARKATGHNNFTGKFSFCILLYMIAILVVSSQ